MPRGIVVILSTMIELGCSIPVAAEGATAIRVSGASTGLVVNGQTVTEAVGSKQPSWTIAIVLGFPVGGPRTAAT